MSEKNNTDRQVSIIVEAVSVFAVSPFLAYIGLFNQTIPKWQRVGLISVALGTVVVDGYLLNKKISE